MMPPGIVYFSASVSGVPPEVNIQIRVTLFAWADSYMCNTDVGLWLIWANELCYSANRFLKC